MTGVVEPGDLPELVGNRITPVLVDIGCGDGRYTLRVARAHPEYIAIGLDPDTSRWSRTLSALRKQKLRNLHFARWSMEEELSQLAGRAAKIHVMLPWASLLDGILGARTDVLRNVLSLGQVGGTMEVVINTRPWTTNANLDQQLLLTPQPSESHLTWLRGEYRALGWHLAPPTWLAARSIRALGSSWGSRLATNSETVMLQLQAVRLR